MIPVTRAEVLPNGEFIARRRELERRLLDVRAARRLSVGDHLTFLFENRLTTWWQVQEMCRVEGITRDAGIQHELDTYNRLGGGDDEIGATLLVEYTEPAERDRMLARLGGLHEHVRLEIGAVTVRPRFDDEQWDARRISSVQFAWFAFTPEARRALFDLSVPAVMIVDHPEYAARAALPAVVRGALCGDLAGEQATL